MINNNNNNYNNYNNNYNNNLDNKNNNGIVLEENISAQAISAQAIYDALERAVEERRAAVQPESRVLIIPPDLTRLYSGAGIITNMLYRILRKRGISQIDIMPALGTHTPMTEDEFTSFFGAEVPLSTMITHNWRRDVVKIGEVPAEFVAEVSDGLVNEAIDVELNRILLEDYSLIISVGQVVPHEVVGMANYSKNIFVGCGGSSMINSSHILGAFYGMERIMGRDFSPVRRVFDYAEEHFLTALPIMYILTVTTEKNSRTDFHGVYIGRDRSLFERAVALSQKYNLIRLREPIKKAVVYLDGREFKSAWLGNKAIYRTRCAMADGGELIILAPGVTKFGEDAENDRLIRKYGYVGREKIIEIIKSGLPEHEDIRNNLSVAAHLIHGSTDGRFSVTYCTDSLTEQELREVNFGHLPLPQAQAQYNPASLRDGLNQVNGEAIFYISNPALGLWTAEK